MINLFSKKFIYILIFALSNIGLFSISSIFHQQLGYDLNTLEEWLYHNRLFMITSAKILAFSLVVILPNIHYFKVDKIKPNFLNWVSKIKRLWKFDSKLWPLHLISCGMLYSLFYDLQVIAEIDLYDQSIKQIFFCLIFWVTDVVFIGMIYKNNIFTNYKYDKIINALLQSLLLVITTSIVTYLTWYDLIQFYIILCCIFYLIQLDTEAFSGYTILIFTFITFSLVKPLNFIINIDETKFYLIADNFSLPWSFIFIVYFFLYRYLNPFFDKLYNYIFIKFTKH